MKRIILALVITAAMTGVTQAKVDLVTLPSRDTQESLTGGFRLEKEVYCVGEPIFAAFEVVNNRQEAFSFDIGGDYRGTLYHHRFSVVIKNKAGRDFTNPPGGHLGGIGTFVTLKPGEKYLQYVLLSSRAHILPPGDYVVEIGRTLSSGLFGNRVVKAARTLDNDSKAATATIRGKLHFTVKPYDFKKLKKALAALGREDRKARESVKRFSIRPLNWALSDVSRKFEMGLSSATENLRAEVIRHLPKKWDDRYYLEAHLDYNRNWLTESEPEEYTLTFTILNNSNKRLESGVLGSRVYVDGEELKEWKNILRRALKDKKAKCIAAGAAMKFSHRFNTYVKEKGKHEIVWQVNDIASKKVALTVRGDGQ